MDATHFEAAREMLAQRASRRAVLGGLGGALLLATRPRVTLGANKPARPFPHQSDYDPGTIRPSRFTQAELEDDVRAAYDAWKTNYLVDAGKNDAGEQMFRIAFGPPGSDDYEVTVSEGQGFGMVIVPHLAGHDAEARGIFDGLFRFARANPSEQDPRLMNWHVPATEGNDSAFDGDSDAVYGLLLADAQWGSDGEIDYLAEAKRWLAGMLESTIGPESKLPLLGDWVEPDGETYDQWATRTSDFMLGHFRAFGRATGEAAWADVVSACAEVISDIHTGYSPETGLMPDFVVLDPTAQPADPRFLEADTDGAYSYNAGRVPWRLGTDALLNGDPASTEIVQAMSTWIEGATGGDPAQIRAGYELDGTPVPDSDYFTTFFAAPFAVAAMLNPDQQAWLDDVYDAIRGQTEGYYEDTVTLLCQLVLSGTFWDPTA